MGNNNISSVSVNHIEELFQVPLLFTWSCFFVGSVIFISIFLWLFLVIFERQSEFVLKVFVLHQVFRGLLITVLGSFVIVLSSGRINHDGMMVIVPELLIFSLALIIYITLKIKDQVSKHEIIWSIIASEPLRMGGVLALVATMWAISVGVGALMYLALEHIHEDLKNYIVLFVFLFWFVSLYVVLNKAKQKFKTLVNTEESCSYYQSFSIHNILMIIILALAIIIAPLYLEYKMNSLDNTKSFMPLILEKA